MLYCFASGQAANATLRSAGFFKAGNRLDASMIFNCAQQVITPRNATKFLVRKRWKSNEGSNLGADAAKDQQARPIGRMQDSVSPLWRIPAKRKRRAGA
jgi:hypothetical protein